MVIAANYIRQADGKRQHFTLLGAVRQETLAGTSTLV